MLGGNTGPDTRYHTPIVASRHVLAGYSNLKLGTCKVRLILSFKTKGIQYIRRSTQKLPE